MRVSTTLALALVVVLAGCTGGGVLPGNPLSTKQVSTSDCGAEPPTGGDRPADPPGDALGWENGVWFNESLTVDQSDGLSCHELSLVRSRAMARVERIRRLEFEQTPTATIVPRRAFRTQLRGGGNDVPAAERALANAKYEALFLVNESANALAVKRRNRAASVSGFYSPSEDTLVLIVNDVSEARVESGLLAHELVHALQDQQFEAVSFPAVEDTARAHKGVTEGDANYVETLYERRCRGPWLGTCLEGADRPERSGEGSELENLGLYALSFQPYSDGPPFVKRIRDRGGWDAVNGLYRDLPPSTEQTIHPSLYPGETPRRVRVRTSPGDGWSRVRPADQSDYQTWGEAGLFTMFLYPSFESDGSFSVVSREAFLTRGQGGLDPYNYSAPASAGWEGDRLVAYRDADGALAYAWTVAFDSAADARAFRKAYLRVLRFHDARRVDGRSNTWRIPEDEPFADAFSVTRTGDTVHIVNAPTVGALGDLDAPPTQTSMASRHSVPRQYGQTKSSTPTSSGMS